MDLGTSEAVTTVRVLNVPSYTNEADFSNWFLFAHGFEAAKLSSGRQGGQIGWAKFDSVDTAQLAIQTLENRPLANCPEGTVLRAEWANKNYKPSNPLKRPHPEEDHYSTPHTHGGLAPAPTPVRVPPPQFAQAPPFRGTPDTMAGAGRNSSTLYFGKLTSDVGEQDFYELFGLCEGFERLKYVPPTEGKSGMCFAKFVSPYSAEMAKARVAGFALPSNPNVPLQVAFAKNDLDQPGNRGAVEVAPPLAASNGGFAEDYRYRPRFAPAPPAAPPVDTGSTPCDTMFIGNIAPNTTENELVNMLTTLQGFVRVKFVGEGTQRPMAFVLFDSEYACRVGIETLHGNALPSARNQALLCQFSKNSLDKPTPKYARQA